VAQDVAEDMVGAAKDGCVKVFIVARVIFQRRNPRPTHTCCPIEGRNRKGPHAALGRHVKDVTRDEDVGDSLYTLKEYFCCLKHDKVGCGSVIPTNIP